MFDLPFTEQNEAGRRDLQLAMMSYLADFARDGDPNGDFTQDLPTWSSWTPTAGQDKLIVFDATEEAADISLSDEALTLPAVRMAWAEAMDEAGLSPQEKATLQSLFGQGDSYSTP